MIMGNSLFLTGVCLWLNGFSCLTEVLEQMKPSCMAQFKRSYQGWAQRGRRHEMIQREQQQQQQQQQQ
jgi:hypothetical protein